MPLPMNVIRHSPLVDVIEARLDEHVPGVQGFLTEATNVALVPNGGGRVARYYVLHPFGGAANPEDALDGSGVAKDWTVQITAAAGTPRDVLALATLIDAAMWHWQPVFPDQGWVAGWFTPPDGYEAPAPIIDKDYTPHRYWLPLQYRTTITAT